MGHKSWSLAALEAGKKLVCGSLDDRWQSRHLSPFYALRGVLLAQPAMIPQSHSRGNHQGGKGSQGSSPSLVSEVFGFILMGSNTLVLLFGNWSLNAAPDLPYFLPLLLRIFPCFYVLLTFPFQSFTSEAGIS